MLRKLFASCMWSHQIICVCKLPTQMSDPIGNMSGQNSDSKGYMSCYVIKIISSPARVNYSFFNALCFLCNTAEELPPIRVLENYRKTVKSTAPPMRIYLSRLEGDLENDILQVYKGKDFNLTADPKVRFEKPE